MAGTVGIGGGSVASYPAGTLLNLVEYLRLTRSEVFPPGAGTAKEAFPAPDLTGGALFCGAGPFDIC